jgi:dihydrofolate synthase/folylpolyglutamate synthase
LERFGRVADALGSPYERLRFVHVAGTNGKGSTVRMVANALALSGYKTGEFTSPYIKVYNDRIRVNGTNITDEELCEIVSQIRPLLEGLVPECSQFEISAAIAFVYFAAKKCVVVVLETGIGGLFDCTNIIRTPLASVITSISYDHTSVLGGSLEAIAAQKAGIIKAERPVIVSPNQDAGVFSVIEDAASSKGCPLVVPDTGKLSVEKSDLSGNRFTYKRAAYVTSMPGAHQIDNALTAIETLRVLKKIGFSKITYAHTFEGIKSAKLLSRCQVINPDNPLIIVDGAQNPDGMRALADFIRTVGKAPKIMICGISEDKDWETALGYITRYIDVGICVDGFAPRSVFAPKLAALFRESEACALRDAVPRAMELAGERGMVIIAGSLYLALALQEQMG